MTVITSTAGDVGASWGPFEQPVAMNMNKMKSNRMTAKFCGLNRNTTREEIFERLFTPVLSMTRLLSKSML